MLNTLIDVKQITTWQAESKEDAFAYFRLYRHTEDVYYQNMAFVSLHAALNLHRLLRVEADYQEYLRRHR